MLKNNEPGVRTRTVTSPNRRMRTGLVATCSLVLVAAGGLLTTAPPAQADITDGLLLRYKLDESAGTVAHDSSGHGLDGTVNGTADLGGAEGLGFNGSDTYVKMPNNVMAGLNSISVDFDVWVDNTLTKPYFMYGLGNTSGTRGNGYLFSTGDTFRTGVSLGDFNTEQHIEPSGGTYTLPHGAWEHVTYTQTGTTGILYENGVEKARNTNVTITPGSIGNGTTTANYLGRSLYANDKYFKGRMRDFRLYNKSLSPAEVEDRANETGLQSEELQALATYNNALAAFEDPNIGPVLIFPSDYTGDIDNVQRPPDWTDSSGRTPTLWPTPTTAKSPLFTADQISVLEEAVYAAVQPDGDTTYTLAVYYDGMSDRVIVQTNAPASVTDPLTTQYDGQLVIDRSTDVPSALPACQPAQAGTTQGLLLDYKLDEPVGEIAHDSSGHGRDGWINGAADLGGDEGLGFNGSDTYVKMPDNIMKGLNSISVDFDVWVDNTLTSPYFFYGLGNTDVTNGNGNGYLFTTGDTFRTSASLTDYTAKKDIQPSGGYTLPHGAWEHVTYTQTGTTGILYENGVEKARNTNVTITPGSIGNGTTTANYLGRSLYANDKYFKGRMRDFRVYDHALTPSQVHDRADEPAKHMEQLQELADYNCAISYFDDPDVGSVITYPSDYTGDLTVQTPTDWTDSSGQTPTSWPQLAIAKSQQFTAAEIKKVTEAVYQAIQPDGDTTYGLVVTYNGPTDKMMVVTNAPASVTDPLMSAYPGKILLEAPPA
ncbi:LamG domain-containing protein [Streptomyces sp. NPDC005760]|uniref:LamG domain-containing protein n=1 Tax=Streptomyces sp. NPDC005760 TaxID=3156718 RepID=UPI0033C61B7B